MCSKRNLLRFMNTAEYRSVHGVFLNRTIFSFITHLRLNKGYRVNSVCYPKTILRSVCCKVSAAFLKGVISSLKNILLKVKVHGVFLNRILFAFITHLRLNVADIGRKGYRINTVCYPKTILGLVCCKVSAAFIKNVISSLKNISDGGCFMPFNREGYDIY